MNKQFLEMTWRTGERLRPLLFQAKIGADIDEGISRGRIAAMLSRERRTVQEAVKSAAVMSSEEEL